MVSASLRSAAGLLRSPAAWLPGLVLGSSAAGFIIIQYLIGLFIAERLVIVLLAIMPFFMAGLVGMVKTGDTSAKSFVGAGRSGYFRVLLPLLLVLFSILITVLLLIVPLMAFGIGGAALVLVVITSGISILFFTSFSDTAAIMEERPVFDSVRRSVEFVLQHTHSCVVFYLTCLAVGGVLWFSTLLAWTIILYERLLPISSLTPEEIQSFSPGQFNALLGLDGIMITAILFLAGITIVFTLLYAFKVFFFRDYSENGGAGPLLQGEYDSKGRWYKY